jgi:RNA 2',3'-cyclic 3'-phosphodiesterase
MIRLFIALDLPQYLQTELKRFCCGLPGAKWVDEQQVHLTLRFIGEVEGSCFKDISEVLENVEMAPFDLQLKGVGCFPPRKKPTVLWVGLETSKELKQLKAQIDSCLKKVNLEPEQRKFSPHITLARLKETPVKRLTNYLSGNALYQSLPFTVSEFHLYSSILNHKGAIHSKEVSYAI